MCHCACIVSVRKIQFIMLFYNKVMFICCNYGNDPESKASETNDRRTPSHLSLLLHQQQSKTQHIRNINKILCYTKCVAIHIRRKCSDL